MADKVKLSKFLKNMEFMKKGIIRKREEEEDQRRQERGEEEIIDIESFLLPDQVEEDGYSTTDSHSLCIGLRFGRFSFQKANPDIEKLMALEEKSAANENGADDGGEEPEEIEITKQEMARVLGNKRRRR